MGNEENTKKMVKAGFFRRLFALVIDIIAMILLNLVIAAVAGGAIFAMLQGGNAEEAVVAGAATAMLVSYVLQTILQIIWIVWEGTTGAALGKILLGMQIRAVDGNPLSKNQLFTRSIVKSGFFVGTLAGALISMSSTPMLLQLGSLISLVSILVGIVVFIGSFLAISRNKQTVYDIFLKTAVFKK